MIELPPLMVLPLVLAMVSELPALMVLPLALSEPPAPIPALGSQKALVPSLLLVVVMAM